MSIRPSHADIVPNHIQQLMPRGKLRTLFFSHTVCKIQCGRPQLERQIIYTFFSVLAGIISNDFEYFREHYTAMRNLQITYTAV